MLEYFGQSPIIVRSSSLLEDAFGNAFAGKYESYFCTNQGTPEERYEKFEETVRKIFASTMNDGCPDVPAPERPRSAGRADGPPGPACLRFSPQTLFLSRTGRRRPVVQYLRLAKGARPQGGNAEACFRARHRAVNRIENDYPRIVALDDPLVKTICKSAGRRAFFPALCRCAESG